MVKVPPRLQPTRPKDREVIPDPQRFFSNQFALVREYALTLTESRNQNALLNHALSRNQQKLAAQASTSRIFGRAEMQPDNTRPAWKSLKVRLPSREQLLLSGLRCFPSDSKQESMGPGPIMQATGTFHPLDHLLVA